MKMPEIYQNYYFRAWTEPIFSIWFREIRFFSTDCAMTNIYNLFSSNLTSNNLMLTLNETTVPASIILLGLIWKLICHRTSKTLKFTCEHGIFIPTYTFSIDSFEIPSRINKILYTEVHSLNDNSSRWIQTLIQVLISQTWKIENSETQNRLQAVENFDSKFPTQNFSFITKNILNEAEIFIKSYIFVIARKWKWRLWTYSLQQSRDKWTRNEIQDFKTVLRYVFWPACFRYYPGLL